MARTLVSIGLFCAVLLFSGLLTVGSFTFTADTVAKVATAAPVKTTNLKSSYIAYLPPAEPEALDVAKSVPVKAVAPKSGPVTPAASPTPSFTHTVAVESLRVRSGPGKTARQIFALKGGTKVTVLKEDGGWVLIMAGGDRIGWVYGKLLHAADQRQAMVQ
jgi:uncharacterized protein YgiM (DUF1202 family)